MLSDRYKILIVDDNEGNIAVLSEILGQLKQCEITSAITGSVALKQILKQEFNLIILDIKLPDIDGYDLARILKSHKRTIDIPIIFCSAIFTAEEWIKKGFELGAIDYLVKPIKEEQLLNKINYYIRLHEKQTGLMRELMCTNKELEKQNRAKSEFLANMSHEIRTPMNGVLGMAQLLQLTELSDEQKDFVEIIITSGKSLLKIINDILDFSKLEDGKVKLDAIEFSIKELVKETITPFVVEAKKKNLQVLYNVREEISDSLIGDSYRLMLILNNLLSNALKFTHVGSIQLDVSLLSRQGSSLLLQFVVRDTGIGIPPNKVDVIFEKFTQADSSTTKNFGGTGLGLAISKSLAAIMDGTIRVESQENSGSSFILEIPFGISPEHQELN
ncbi:MAG TPA: ATP-binding protein [Alphaproteobacteria bacterium]|nr:ATP-binding protein [Alphaproteobacteria bacterium]